MPNLREMSPEEIVNLVLSDKSMDSSVGIALILDRKLPFYETFSQCNRIVVAGNVDEIDLVRIFREMALSDKRVVRDVETYDSIVTTFLSGIKSRISEHARLADIIFSNIDRIPDNAQCRNYVKDLPLQMFRVSYVTKAKPQYVRMGVICNVFKNMKTLVANGFRDDILELIRTLDAISLKSLSNDASAAIREHPSYFMKIFKGQIDREILDPCLPFFSVIKRATKVGASLTDIKAGIIWCINNGAVKNEEWLKSVSPGIKIAALDDWACEKLAEHRNSATTGSSFFLGNVSRIVAAVDGFIVNDRAIMFLIANKTSFISEFVGVAVGLVESSGWESDSNSELEKFLKRFPPAFHEEVAIQKALNTEYTSLNGGKL